LIEDASRGVDLRPGDVTHAIEEMKRADITVVRSAELLKTAMNLRTCLAAAIFPPSPARNERGEGWGGGHLSGASPALSSIGWRRGSRAADPFNVRRLKDGIHRKVN
jgi:hypothetical protein